MHLWLAVALAGEPPTFPLPPKPALADLDWVAERYEGAGWQGYTPAAGPWVAYPGLVVEQHGWSHFRKGPTLARAATTADVDLARTPWLEVEVPRCNMPWRLTAQRAGGPEVLLADAQLAGTFRSDLGASLATTGPQRVTLRLYATTPGGEIDFGARFLATGAPTRADVALGELATLHGRDLSNAAGLTSRVAGWPRLMWNRDNRAAWRTRILQSPAAAAITDGMRDRSPFVVDASVGADRIPKHALAIRPPEPSVGNPPYLPVMRDIVWWGFNEWELAAAVSDDPEITAQARRWTLSLVDSRFWTAPEWTSWDDDVAYPLMAMAEGYDLARESMTEPERARTREAIHAVATNFYWNILVKNGYIENDLRSNHAGSAFHALGIAGLVLLGEDPDAAVWVSLSELRMEDTFALHTSGATWESPAYGRYMVAEWFKLATMLANVTGREHRDDPYWRRHADFEVAVADWDARDLGYNQGGPHQWWNQWVLLGIAAFTRDPRHQWVGSASGVDQTGYGELPFYRDPTLAAERPKERNAGYHYPDIGVATWRTGWDPGDSIVLFHDGPRPLTHQDRGAGHVTFYGRGHRFLDDGLGALSDGHNLVTWDNQPQNQYVGGAMSRFFQDPRAGAATGDYSAWRRVVLYLRPDVLVLVDRLDVFDQNPDRVGMSTFHVTAPDVRVDGPTFTAIEGDAALQATIALDNDVVPDGRLGPGPAGSKTIAWRFGSAGKSRVHLVTVLSVSKPDEARAVAVTRDGSTWRFRTGGADVVVGLGKGEVSRGVSADAEVWAAQVDAGRPRVAIACGGAHALTGGNNPASNADCAAVDLP